MRVGLEANAEPMSFVNSAGTIDGFAAELVTAIAAEMKFVAHPVVGTWEDLLSRFKQGEIDVLANLAYLPERDTFVDFAVTHLAFKGVFFVKKDTSPLRQASDLATVRIGLLKDSFAHAYVTEHSWDQHLVFMGSLRDALHALDEGQCDAVLAVGTMGNSILRKDGLRNIAISEVTPQDLSYTLHMGVHSGDATRLALLNEGLARIHANGTYDRLYEKWIGPVEPRRGQGKDARPLVLPVTVLVVACLGWFAWVPARAAPRARICPGAAGERGTPRPRAGGH